MTKKWLQLHFMTLHPRTLQKHSKHCSCSLNPLLQTWHLTAAGCTARVYTITYFCKLKSIFSDYCTFKFLPANDEFLLKRFSLNFFHVQIEFGLHAAKLICIACIALFSMHNCISCNHAVIKLVSITSCNTGSSYYVWWPSWHSRGKTNFQNLFLIIIHHCFGKIQCGALQ